MLVPIIVVVDGVIITVLKAVGQSLTDIRQETYGRH